MMKYIVDRIEKNYAVCFDENDKYVEIPVENFGFQVLEGMVVLYDEQKNSYVYDKVTTEKLLEENRNKLKRLFDRN